MDDPLKLLREQWPEHVADVVEKWLNRRQSESLHDIVWNVRDMLNGQDGWPSQVHPAAHLRAAQRDELETRILTALGLALHRRDRSADKFLFDLQQLFLDAEVLHKPETDVTHSQRPGE